MSTLKLAKYTDDDSLLNDADDAAFVQRKLKPDVALDFSGVLEVSAVFLDVLLKAETPESIGDRLTGMNDAVDGALAAWVDRASDPVKPVEKPKSRTKVRRPTKGPARPVIEREPTGDERFTPTRLIERLRTSLRGYIESAYPLSDPTLIRARRVLLEQEADGHLLAQEPYIETTTRYANSEKDYQGLGLATHVAEFFQELAQTKTEHSTPEDPRTVLYPSMYGHQEEAFRAFLAEGKDIVVATGTGSGKTECFLVPMVGTMYDEAVSRPESFALPGVRALVLYPMNALVNDQLSRLRLLFGETSVMDLFKNLGSDARFPRFGMYTGRTPYPGPRQTSRDGERVQPLLEYYLNMPPELEARLKRLGRYPAKDIASFLSKGESRRATYKTGKKAGKEYTKHRWERRLHTHLSDRELMTRQEMVHGSGTQPGHAPDVLVTNYSMLEYMLMRPFERPIFAETKRWLAQDGNQLLLVLDEAHMYRGAKGAEVAFLIRRLRARLGIDDQPDKIRIIATSASLGSSEEAQLNVRRFIADLTGKSPETFEAITGSRDVPEPAAVATTSEATRLAELDLDAINEALDPADLRALLAPFIPSSPKNGDGSEAQVLRDLYAALVEQPYVNQLIQEAAGNARALSDLATAVFPEAIDGRRALEALLTVGTLARLKADEPGLIPTRVHGMFRGLHGLYACINTECSGRQADPGQGALLGKLFTAPCSTCDACAARVFEIASCRSCGSPYILGYAEDGGLDQLQFLWGETEGALFKVQLLPCPPRYTEHTEELRVHLRTGYIDLENRFPDDEVRNVHVWLDPDGTRQAVFDRCPMCQPAAPARSHIYDFRTRGEQPFTALIEAQFAEQPPQNRDKRLPNHGRKVLVFSDGRQKAARLAPALEHSHARDLFRQVVALASKHLRDQGSNPGMQYLYAGVVWLCAQKGYDIFPSIEEVEFHNHVEQVRGKSLTEAINYTNLGWLAPTRSFAQALFSEITDRYYSLPSLALATIEEDPVIRFIFDDFPDVGLDMDGAQVLFRAWVRQHLERRSFKPPGAQLSDLGEGWAGPVGIDASNMKHVLPYRFPAYLEHILDGDADAVDKVSRWFQTLVRQAGMLHFEGDRYYLQLNGLSLNLRLESTWLRCTDCGRIHPEVLAEACPACLGQVVDADPDYLDARTGFYRSHVLRAFDERTLEPFGLSAAEHSAQLTGQPDASAFNKVEEYELRFQDIPLEDKAPIDILSCTTTMEVGIDIGALSGVALRNVPPHVANYQQRAGRAGRRGRSIASVITYAHGTSHDAHYFEHPHDIISGTVRAPIVYIENQEVLERHIHAYLVQRFFHDSVPPDPTAYDLFGSLGEVGKFLSGTHACSLNGLEQWLDENAELLRSELTDWVPAYSHAQQAPITDVAQTIQQSIGRTKARIRAVLPVEEYEKKDELEGLELEALEQRLEEQLLQALIGHAVLPRYAFPTDVVAFWVSKPRRPGDPNGRRVYDYQPQRDLQLALTEYAPGRSLTIDKWRFESAALFSPYEPTPVQTLARRQPYTSCGACAWVSLEPTAAALTLCPICASDELTRMSFITPAGFAPDLNKKREVDRGQSISYAGRTDRARLEVQDPPGDWDSRYYGGRLAAWTGSRKLAMVNKGIGNRGFRVCPDCGRAEPEYGPGYTKTKLTKGGAPTQHLHPMERGMICTGAADGPFFLGHRFPTDALLLRMRAESPVRLGTISTPGLLSRASRMALTSLVESVSLAASRVLQIDEGELSGWWTPVLGGRTDEAQLYLYDLLPGGAGYARAVGDSLEDVLDATEAILTGCDCPTSCYRCIRHYGNNWIHASLDRHLALSLLHHIRHGTSPSLSANMKSTVLNGLCEYLELRGIESQRDFDAGGATIPLSVRLAGGDVWIDVHHALVDPAVAGSEVASAAQAQFLESISLDAYDLQHDLPAAVEMLQVPSRVSD